MREENEKRMHSLKSRLLQFIKTKTYADSQTENYFEEESKLKKTYEIKRRGT